MESNRMNQVTEAQAQDSLASISDLGLGAKSRTRSWLWAVALAVAPLVAACGTEVAGGSEGLEGLEGLEGEPVVAAAAEEAFPGRSGEVSTAVLETEQGQDTVSYELIDGNMVMEGDIILGRSSGQYTAQSAIVKSRRWPGCVIPYEIDPNMSGQKRVLDAIKHWHDKTAVTLVPRKGEQDYVLFSSRESGCSSAIGRSGGRQVVNLGSSCSTGNAIHEIGHALGMFHEQSRQDRDDFITVNLANVESSKRNNFNKYQSASGTDLGKFDFGSIMLYGSYFFSANKKPTMVRKNGTTFEAQRNGLSAGDLAAPAKICGQ
ncbi:MAG TPA: M12 family metallopeptidase [Pseudomonadota bacterium]|nr:M12 family metallopeptidase [Pseudomonadota bacterium]